jgi:predicted nucleotide-binding protein (sugar kinase/HSP70/actin superfamily)
MAKSKTAAFELDCPCCGATLKIDPEVKAVLDFKEKPKPKTIEDLQAGVAKLQREKAEREAAFQKSFEQMKSSKEVLARKFDELLKKAKEDDSETPPPRPFDLD